VKNTTGGKLKGRLKRISAQENEEVLPGMAEGWRAGSSDTDSK